MTDWMTCTQGLALLSDAPPNLSDGSFLASKNPYERAACVLTRAQRGDFDSVSALLEVARENADWRLSCSVLELYGMCAPTSRLREIQEFFVHEHYDVRLGAYSGSRLSCSLDLADALIRHRVTVRAAEREFIDGELVDLLETADAESEFYDQPVDIFLSAAAARLGQLRARVGRETSVYYAEPLSAEALVAAIRAMCAEEDSDLFGGTIAKILSLVEAMTGHSYVGCLDDDCSPVMSVLSATLNRLYQSKTMDALQPGRRYFFGHEVP